MPTITAQATMEKRATGSTSVSTSAVLRSLLGHGTRGSVGSVVTGDIVCGVWLRLVAVQGEGTVALTVPNSSPSSTTSTAEGEERADGRSML